MNDQLQNQLADIIGKLASLVSQAGTFTLEQLPDIAQSYVLYGRVALTSGFLACVLGTLLSIYIALVKGVFNDKAVKTDFYHEGDWKESRVFCTIFGSVIGIFSLIPLFSSGKLMALVWFAPKVWLIQEFAHMLK